MNVAELINALRSEAKRRAYIRRLEIVEHTYSLLKVRMSIAGELFI